MRTKTVEGMSYEVTGEKKSKRKDIENGVLREMTVSRMVIGVGREIYRRYDTEILAGLLFSSWALFIYVKLV